MLRVQKNEKTILLLFNAEDTIKENFLTQFFLFNFFWIFVYVIGGPNLMGFVYILLILSMIIGWIDRKQITEILLDDKKIEVFKENITNKKKKLLYSLEYKNIEKIKRVYIGSRLSLHTLNVVTISGEEHEILTTSLKEDIDKIIEIYYEKKSNIVDEPQEREEELLNIYNLETEERYYRILENILKETRIILLEQEGKYFLNPMKGLQEQGKEIDFYFFYVNYLMKEEYQEKTILVGYNGINGKEVFFRELKEDINKIRDSR